MHHNREADLFKPTTSTADCFLFRIQSNHAHTHADGTHDAVLFACLGTIAHQAGQDHVMRVQVYHLALSCPSPAA